MAKPRLPNIDYPWTPELAYAIGLLVTDGNLSKNGRNITMRSSDLEILETFKKCLRIQTPIARSVNDGYAVKPSYRVQYTSVQFYRWLVKIGLFPNKTYTIGKINVPDEYFRDFLRGHLDGDGTILLYEDRYNNYKGRTYTNIRLYTEFISVSEQHIRWLYAKIISLAGIKAALIKNAPGSEDRVPIWVIKVAKKNSLKLLPWIYYDENLPMLKRKRTKARVAIQSISKEQRRPYTRIVAQ